MNLATVIFVNITGLKAVESVCCVRLYVVCCILLDLRQWCLMSVVFGCMLYITGFMAVV